MERRKVRERSEILHDPGVDPDRRAEALAAVDDAVPDRVGRAGALDPVAEGPLVDLGTWSVDVGLSRDLVAGVEQP